MKTKITKKASISISSLVMTKGVLKLKINGFYRRIKDVASVCGVVMPTRRGFCLLNKNPDKANAALWCIHLSPNKNWTNTLSNDGKIIIEKKTSKESIDAFQKRFRNGRIYDVNIPRICFAEKNGLYRFIGVFQVAQVDFENSSVVFKKKDLNQMKVNVEIRRKVTILVEEETMMDVSL